MDEERAAKVAEGRHRQRLTIMGVRNLEALL
jgi:hypothetical protein